MDKAKLLNQLAFLRWSYHGISLGSALAFIVISAVLFFALKWLRAGSARRLAAFAASTATTVDDLIVRLIRRTSSLFLAVMALYAGSGALALSSRTRFAIHVVVLLTVLWQVGIWAHQVIDYSIGEVLRRHPEEDAGLRTAAGAMGFIGRLAVWSMLLLVALNNLNVNVTTLIAGLGVGGIAVALAVQNVLGDLFASLSILFDRPFAVGHFIVIDNLAGTVQHVGLKTTRVQSLSGEEIILSNSDLLKSRIHNYKRLQERRILFSFGVTYDTGYEKLCAIPAMVREIVEQTPKTRFDRAHFKEYGDSSLNFEVVYYVLEPDYNLYMDTQQSINLELYKRCEQQGIEFAFPTRTLYVNRVSGPPELGVQSSPASDSAQDRS